MVGWWLVHLSWVDHPQLRVCHRNPHNFWQFWGCLCICQANHSVSIYVLLTRLDLVVFLLQSLSGGSLWRLTWIWHQLRSSLICVSVCEGRLLRASARSISLPGLYVMVLSYCCSQRSILCSLPGAAIRFFILINSSGLWSVSTVNVLYR